MKTLRAVLAAAVLLAPGLALADDKADAEAFMWGYLKLWNAHDAGAIMDHVYRLEPTHPWSKPGGLQAEFDRLKAQGYDHTDTSSVKACITAPGQADVELRFVRLKTDGEPMPPKDRVSLYHLKKFDDGWRVVGMSGLPAGGKMACPG